METNPIETRRYDLDWLRVLAFTALILYHTGMMFNTWDWHIKNNRTSDFPEAFMAFTSQWRMPLLFFVSGSALWFALKKYSNKLFVKERLKRLLLPLVFGMFVIIPPQVYYERLFQGQSFESLTAFYATVLQFQPYPAGNFSWHHLWYIPYILIFSFLALPLFRYLKTEKGRQKLDRISAWLEKDGRLFLLFLPFFISEAALRPFWPSNNNNLVSDWAQFSTMFLVFCSGYALVSCTNLQPVIEKLRWRAVLPGTLSVAGLFLFWESDMELAFWQMTIYRLLRMLNLWCWILAILGFARIHLNRNHRFLEYANAAVYPFYILHQTITVSLGYYLIRWNASIALKFLIVASGTFAGCFLLYEGLIKRSSLTRMLFGMKPLQKRLPAFRKPEPANVKYLSWEIE